MALTPAQIEGIREAAALIAEPVTEWLLKDIAERISAAGKMTSTAAYEIYRTQALGQARRGLKKFLKRQLGISYRQIRQLFRQAARLAGEEDYRRAGKDFDFADSEISRMAEAAADLAKKDFTNLTQTIGMTAPDGKAYPLQKTYQKAMDFAFEKVFTGAQDYQGAIRDATRQLAARGVRVIDYESGVHTSLEAAVRRNVMGGMGLLVEQIEQKNHDELGCNGWEISAHLNSAPDHEPYQGRQYSDAEFAALNGTAERPGKLKRRIGTLNCGHIGSPIILGVDSPQYTEAELADMRRKNAEGITFEGRHYTGYEATQMQRRMELSIRQQKWRIIVAQVTGDSKTLQAAKVRKQILNLRYIEFSQAAGLRTQEQRLEVAGFKSGKDGPEFTSLQKQTTSSFTSNQQHDILNSVKSDGSVEKVEIKQIGRLDSTHLQSTFGPLRTTEVIITDERIAHIKERHPEDYALFEEYGTRTVETPDLLIQDTKHTGTVFAVKKLSDTNLNVIVRLALDTDDPSHKNSVMTFYRIREKNLLKLIQKHHLLYKRE